MVGAVPRRPLGPLLPPARKGPARQGCVPPGVPPRAPEQRPLVCTGSHRQTQPQREGEPEDPLSLGHLRAVRGHVGPGVCARRAGALPPAVRGSAVACQLHRGRPAASDPAGQGAQGLWLRPGPRQPGALQVRAPSCPLCALSLGSVFWQETGTQGPLASCLVSDCPWAHHRGISGSNRHLGPQGEQRKLMPQGTRCPTDSKPGHLPTIPGVWAGYAPWLGHVGTASTHPAPMAGLLRLRTSS